MLQFRDHSYDFVEFIWINDLKENTNKQKKNLAMAGIEPRTSRSAARIEVDRQIIIIE
jgi:hypothetical protein